MKVYHVPTPEHRPPSGGVAEHIRQLTRHLGPLGVKLVRHRAEADIVHVQTAYTPPPGLLHVWTCHGGFLPRRLPQVESNLKKARIVISVAQWVVDAFFGEYNSKTVVIPNGVDLTEFVDLPASGLEPGYVLWGKGFLREDWWWFYRLAQSRPRLRFVTALAPHEAPALDNLQIIGLQSPAQMKAIMSDCAVYVSTGSEVCPTMVLEAWACSKPVLAWDGHGNRELMETDLAPPCAYGVRGGTTYHDFEGMTSGLDWCLEYGIDHGRTGRQYVGRFHQWADLAKRTAEVYEGCLS